MARLDELATINATGVQVTSGAASAVVAIPNAFEAGEIVEQARAVNPTLEIVARAHSDAEVDYLKGFGADFIIMGEREIARGMIQHLLGPPADAAAAFIPPQP